MRVVIILTLLGLLLTGGANNAFVTPHHTSTSYSPVYSVKVKHPVHFTPRNTVVKKAGLESAPEKIATSLIEDEDVSQSAGRKYKLLACFFTALLGMLVLSAPRKFMQNRSPFWDLLSLKYITQRTLRI